jgi:hypothetical protein
VRGIVARSVVSDVGGGFGDEGFGVCVGGHGGMMVLWRLGVWNRRELKPHKGDGCEENDICALARVWQFKGDNDRK